ncbi:MAG: TRAP transporter substrate-binding protein DctP [Sphingobacteriales bacterium]|nr:MAG: TRAP transporter substrate-binding protein DctP [Sphingobacteriales bacterium]
MEKESKGRIKTDAYWNGELSISYDALKKIGEGDTIDITTIVPEYAAKELPRLQIFKSFLVGPSGKKQVSFFRKMFETVPEFTTELQQNNVVPIFLSTGYGVGFFSKNQIDSLSDLKNKTWRTASFWHRDYLKKFGSIPVSIPWGPEVYKAFEENRLDGLMVNIDGAYQLKVYEQAPYLLTSKKLWLGHLYIVSINKNIWERLEQIDKDAILRAAAKSYKKLGKIMDESYKEQLVKLAEKGVKYRVLSKKEVKDFENNIQYNLIQQDWIKEQELKSVNDLNSILEKMKNMLRK